MMPVCQTNQGQLQRSFPKAVIHEGEISCSSGVLGCSDEYLSSASHTTVSDHVKFEPSSKDNKHMAVDKSDALADLVLARLEGSGWWPGKIVRPEGASERPLLHGCSWIQWFGLENKVSQMATVDLEPIGNFAARFSRARFKSKRSYRACVIELLHEASSLLDIDVLKPKNKYEKKRRTEILMKWALSGFQACQSLVKSGFTHDQENRLLWHPSSIAQNVELVRCERIPKPFATSEVLPDATSNNSRANANVDREIARSRDEIGCEALASRPTGFKEQELAKPSAALEGRARHGKRVFETVDLSLIVSGSEKRRCFVDATKKVSAKRERCGGKRSSAQSLPQRDPSICKNDDSIRESMTGTTGLLITPPVCVAEHRAPGSKRKLPAFSSHAEDGLGTASPLENKNSSIDMDFSLMGSTPPKRHCFLDAAKKIRPDNSASEQTLSAKAGPDVASRKEDGAFSTDSHSSCRKGKDDCLNTKGNLALPTQPSHFLAHGPPSSAAQGWCSGDLVFGKLKSFDWWPGKVVAHTLARQSPASPGCVWVMWFGDRKVSQLQSHSLEPITRFRDRYHPRLKLKSSYCKGVREALEEAAQRAKKTDIPLGGSDEEDALRLNCLIQWALSGFEPHGWSSLRLAGINDEGGCVTAKSIEERNGSFVDSPELSYDVKAMFDKVADGKRSIETLCLACGDTEVATEHPLFEGGLCQDCKESFLECAYLYDEDGFQMYCSVCCAGDKVVLCDTPGCCRSFCNVCIDMFCGTGYSKQISLSGEWSCFMCTGDRVRLLKRRDDWQERMKAIFQTVSEGMDFKPHEMFQPVPVDDRRPIRVLGLFDGIGTGYHVLKELGFEIDLYISSEVDEQAVKVTQVRHGDKVKHVGDACLISEKNIEDWGPFDLVIGGSPCNDLSIANPLRKGIYGDSGRLFFDFFRLLTYARPRHGSARPFFWLFENVVGMRHCDRDVITRFLQCQPTLVSSRSVSAQQRNRYFWGNLPGMNRTPVPHPNDKLVLQDCLEPHCGRIARFEKVKCITTMSNSLKQTKRALLPVQWKVGGSAPDEDGLWITEIERLFGFPDHYTDVANMGQTQRQKLLGKAWSVPVIRHLFAPLKNYFKANER